jgi:hypothetical protein
MRIPHYNEISHIFLPINPTPGCQNMNFIAVHIMDRGEEKPW